MIKKTASKALQLAPKPPVISTPKSANEKHKNMRKTGPQLFITKILMLNGCLSNKQIWKIYQRQLEEAKTKDIQPEIQYWPSLTKLKTTLKFMRLNGKIISNGYTFKSHTFHGWKIQQKRALKYVHPEIVSEIHKQLHERQNI